MFTSEDELPDDVDSLKALVLDLSRRLQNAQHTIDAERKSALQASLLSNFYRSKLQETSSAFRVEAARMRNSEIKFRREKDARRYEENKARNTALLEEMRIAELDCQMAGLTKTVPVRLARLRSKVGSVEQEQQSLRSMLSQLSEIEAMNEKLVTASQMGNLTNAVTLLQAGADVNYLDAAGFLPIHYACREGSKDLVQLLLQNGSDFNARLSGHCPIVLAARRGHNEVVELLLENGANVEEKGVDGYPALITAYMHDRIHTVRFLLEFAKADINSVDLDENTTLHHAVRSERQNAADIIQYLLDQGASLDVVNRQGNSPLQVALQEKRKIAMEAITGIKVEENDQPARAGSASRARKSSMMVFTPILTKPRHVAGSASALAKAKASSSPMNAIPKHKRTTETSAPPSRKTSQKKQPSARPSPARAAANAGLAKGSELDAGGDEGLEMIREENSTSQILSPEGLSFVASTSVASSVTFDPE